MSTDAADQMKDSAEFVDRASRLLTDFTARLQGLAQQLAEKKTQPEAAERFKSLRAPAEELARQISAELEVGRASELEKVELWLRLADFEYFLRLCTRQSGQSDRKAPNPMPAKPKSNHPWLVPSGRGK